MRRTIAEADGADEVMIGGGGEIYRAGDAARRPAVHHAMSTLEPEGDMLFPAIDPERLDSSSSEPEVAPDPKDSAALPRQSLRAAP